MNMKLKKGLVGLATLPMIIPIQSIHAWETIDYNENKLKEQKSFNLDELYNRVGQGLVDLNEDVGVLEFSLSASEAKTSPIIQMTKGEPIIMGVEDGHHNRAVIQIITSKRHSDGSATIRQKTISPGDLKPRSDGGILTDIQYSIMTSAYGNSSPFEYFEQDDHVWYGTKPNETQAIMGVLMQYMGATHGIYALMEADVRSWTTSSGGPFSKKVTTHVRTHIVPHWTILLPVDVGSHYVEPNIPMFTIEKDNKNYVIRGGVHAVATGETTNFYSEREELSYEKKSDRALTGFTLVFTAIVIGALTGGAGLLGTLSYAQGAAVAGAGAMTGLTIAGSKLHDPVANDFGSLLLKTATSGIEAREKDLTGKGFGNEWKKKMKELVDQGPLEGSRGYNSEMQEDVVKWDTIVTPNTIPN